MTIASLGMTIGNPAETAREAALIFVRVDTAAPAYDLAVNALR
jgi:hypothetical protein